VLPLRGVAQIRYEPTLVGVDTEPVKHVPPPAATSFGLASQRPASRSASGSSGPLGQSRSENRCVGDALRDARLVLVAASRIERIRNKGFVVLRGDIDPVPLGEEFDTVFRDAFEGDEGATTRHQGSGTVAFKYAPMMCERTPISLALVDKFSVIAADLLGRAVLPGRAKGSRYFGDTSWHRDSEHDVVSLGVVCYLEALRAGNGALEVIAGSHSNRSMRLPDATSGDATDSYEVIETEPGDVIIFDEHLIHGSTGGDVRRQWRVDFVIDPDSEHETASVGGWFDQSIPDEHHDPGYNAERYPSYGPHWRALGRPWTQRLRELGVYQRTGFP
jgi:hypothetical protein